MESCCCDPGRPPGGHPWGVAVVFAWVGEPMGTVASRPRDSCEQGGGEAFGVSRREERLASSDRDSTRVARQCVLVCGVAVTKDTQAV